jgi:imidazolonepropionase-like amidohydrolase
MKITTFTHTSSSARAVACPRLAGENYALVHCNIFNGYENSIQADMTVLVRDRLIESIGAPGSAVPDGYTVINCAGNYLMPGMMDVHTHVENLEQAQRALRTGVTTLRTAGVPAYQDIGLRELVRSGGLPGPDVVAAGVYVTPNLEDTILADPRLAVLVRGVNTDDELRLLVNVNIDRGWM